MQMIYPIQYCWWYADTHTRCSHSDRLRFPLGVTIMTCFLWQVPEIRERILTDNKGKWKKIAKKQSQTCFNPSTADVQAQAKRLVVSSLLSFLQSFNYSTVASSCLFSIHTTYSTVATSFLFSIHTHILQCQHLLPIVALF